MAAAAVSSNPRTVEDIFKDYTARRTALLRALTKDVDDFYSQCDPEKENLCLYGHPNESWEVNLPAEEVPPKLHEPALGINFARDGMQRKDWLSLVAVHSDCWLHSVSFYFELELVLIAMRGRHLTDTSPPQLLPRQRQAPPATQVPEHEQPPSQPQFDEDEYQEEEQPETSWRCISSNLKKLVVRSRISSVSGCSSTTSCPSHYTNNCHMQCISHRTWHFTSHRRRHYTSYPGPNRR